MAVQSRRLLLIPETGIKTFKCKECDETRTEEIPSLDKTYHIKSVVARPAPLRVIPFMSATKSPV